MSTYTVTVNFTASNKEFSFSPDILTVSRGRNTINFVQGNASTSNAWNFSSISFTEESAGRDNSPFTSSVSNTAISVTDVVTKNETWDYSIQVDGSTWSDPKIVNRDT